MGGRVGRDAKATKRLMPLFESYYEDAHQEKYFVNWPMIKTAEKVGEHYTIGEVDDTLKYYFSSRTKHNIWDFLSDIDTLCRAAVDEQKKAEDLEELLEKTKKKIGEL